MLEIYWNEFSSKRSSLSARSSDCVGIGGLAKECYRGVQTRKTIEIDTNALRLKEKFSHSSYITYSAKKRNMQQPVTGQQFESDKSQGYVPLNQPVVPVTGQPVLASSATGQPVIAMPASGQSVLAAPPPGQQMMCQVPPGQQQPVFVQAIPGQHVMLPQGSPIQYYVPPGGQPAVQQPQQVQMLQPVQGQGVPGQPQPHQDPEMAPITVNKAYLRSHLGVSRVSELVSGSII